MIDRAATSKSVFRTGCRGHTAISVATARIAIGTPSRRSRPLSVVSDLTRLPVSGPRFARRRREGSRCYKFRRLEVEDAVDDLGNLAHAANGVQGAELRTGFARRRLVTDKLRLERRGRRGTCSCGRVKLPALVPGIFIKKGGPAMGPPLEVRVGLAEAATLHDPRERVTGILAWGARSCGMPFCPQLLHF